jgi:hypothetical protein
LAFIVFHARGPLAEVLADPEDEEIRELVAAHPVAVQRFA